VNPIIATLAWAKCCNLQHRRKSNQKKSDHKKLDIKKQKKIDKNVTFILQDRYVNHIVAKNQ